jgi:hypothetical protein
MQDNELDKLINDAANQHHPPYDDKAWGKMLVLLDKHLPQKKDRRKPFVFWLLFLLLGGAVTLGIVQPWNNTQTTTNGSTATAEAGGHRATTAPQQPATNAPGKTENITTAVTPTAETKTNKGAIPDNAEEQHPAAATAAIVQNNTGTKAVQNGKTTFIAKGRSAIKIKRPAAVAGEEEIFTEAAIVKQQRSKKPVSGRTAEVAPQESEPVPVENPVAINKPNTDPANTVAEKEKQLLPAQKDSATTKTNPAVTAAAAAKNKKSKGFSNNFAISVSGGADMSFVELANPGKVKFIYGAGAAYAIGKRLKISTGFYVSKKVYDAEPYQYKFPNGVTYPYLTEINGDCNIYEIPLNVYYNFKQHKNHNWFAGAGLSSLLMKKEHYNYQYKTPAGQWYSYERTVTNENKHYFSVATLSGGYQYTLSNRIAFTAEPYVKIPLGGVGAGKIKLNSSGILLSAAVKPFVRTKK